MKRWFVDQHTTTYLLVNELHVRTISSALTFVLRTELGYNNNVYQVVLYPLRLRRTRQSWGYNNNAYQVVLYPLRYVRRTELGYNNNAYQAPGGKTLSCNPNPNLTTRVD